MNRFARMLVATAMAVTTTLSAAQDKTVRIVVPFPAGATLDAMARLLAPRLKDKLGVTFVVDNRAGAAGNLGAEYVLRAPPDGNTLLFTAPATLVVNKQLYPKVGFDHTSFTPVSLVAGSAFVWFVRPELPIHTVQELVAYSKAHPDKLSFGSMGSGTASHLILAAFNAETGANILHVPFQGAAPALNALLGGQVDTMVNGLTMTTAHMKAGKLRPIGITSPQRNPKVPDVPAMAESLPRLPGTGNWFAFLAPPATPSRIVDGYAEAVKAVLAEPEVRAAMDRMGVDPIGSTPAELAAYMAQESRVWTAVAKNNGITAE